jgi:hypothetical protein
MIGGASVEVNEGSNRLQISLITEIDNPFLHRQFVKHISKKITRLKKNANQTCERRAGLVYNSIHHITAMKGQGRNGNRMD